ncbi:hypothetical protein FOCC_FOCC016569 [Frankliniella occidentalis]|nr:hypothetical protein FOCC_FOCC016569 [Frankliniella occidentalis]
MREKGQAVGLNLIPVYETLKSGDRSATPLVSSQSSILSSGADAAGDTADSQETLIPGSQGSYKPVTTKETFDDINKFMVVQKRDPIDLKKLKSQTGTGYALEQVDILFKIFLSLAEQPAPSVSLPTAMKNSDYFGVMISQLQNYFVTAPKNADKIHALSVLPASMPIEKLEKILILVIKTKSLVGQCGILCTPNKGLGRTLPENVLNAVIKFYLRQDISKELPGKNNFRSVRENGERVRKKKHLLMNNVGHVYKEFVKANPDMEIGRSKFAELRPKQCCLASQSGMHNVCVCAIHENPTLMFNGAHLNKIPDLKSQSVTDCIKFFVCNPPTPECYFRTCQKCPDKSLFLKLIQDYFDAVEVEEVTYNQWEAADRGNIITRISKVEAFEEDFVSVMEDLWEAADRGNIITRISKVEDFEEDFVSVMEDLVTHHFIYKEQSAFFNERLSTLKEGEVVIVGDFAENYTYVVQDCAQAMYFRQKQCTLHPFSVSYWDELKGGKVQKGYAVISDHMDHNTAAFYAFQKKKTTGRVKKQKN